MYEYAAGEGRYIANSSIIIKRVTHKETILCVTLLLLIGQIM